MNRRPGRLVSLSRRLRDIPYLRKWLVLGAIIGVIAGLGAAAFSLLLDLATRVLLGGLAGYTPPSPLGEGGEPVSDALRPWAIPAVVALGGLVSGILVTRLAPEAEGHGTDAAIAAFHHHARRVRARIPLVKMVASAITIGAGGSGGREGPTAQIGAGFGSLLARILDLDARDARIAVACGMGAGIGAIFRAPLGGAVLAAEIPYRDDVEADALVPSFVASIVAFAVFGSIISFSPIFGEQSAATFTEPIQLAYYALIGLAAGLVGRLYVRTFYWFTAVAHRWPLPAALRPAIGGFAVGLLALAVPGVLGTGYGWVQVTMTREGLLGLPFLMVIALPFAKILATSLSIGSGGSGGVFGPGMVVGGFLGAIAWRILEPVAPGVPFEPAGFVIVGMMALFGSVAHAPLAVMLMVAEMTGNLAMLAPAMVAIGVASLVVGDISIYTSQLRTRVDSPGHRFRVALPLMAAIGVAEAAREPRAVVRADEPVGVAHARLKAAGVPGAPVIESDGRLVGVVDTDDLVGRPDLERIGTAISAREPILSVDDRLDDALGALTDHRRDWAPVEADGRLAGILSARDAIAAYRQALSGNIRQVRGLRTGGHVVETRLAAGSALIGQAVAAIPWPRETVLVAIERGESLLVPRGDLQLAAGDQLSIFAAPGARPELTALLERRSVPDDEA